MLSLPHGRLLLGVGWFLVIAIVAGELGPPVTGGAFSISDKVQHFACYFALTLWFAGLYPRDRLFVIALAFFSLGGILEVLQGLLTTTRQMDVIDVAANSLGIAAATVVAAAGLSSWAFRVEAWLSRRAEAKARQRRKGSSTSKESA